MLVNNSYNIQSKNSQISKPQNISRINLNKTSPIDTFQRTPRQISFKGNEDGLFTKVINFIVNIFKIIANLFSSNEKTQEAQSASKPEDKSVKDEEKSVEAELQSAPTPESTPSKSAQVLSYKTPEDLEEAYNSAKQIIKDKEIAPDKKVRLLNNISVGLAFAKDTEKAREIAQKAFDLATTDKDKTKSIFVKALCSVQEKSIQKAFHEVLESPCNETYSAMIGKYQKLIKDNFSENSLEGCFINNLAASEHLYNDEPQKAFDALKKPMSFLYEKENDILNDEKLNPQDFYYLRSRSEKLIGRACFELNQMDNAKESYERALDDHDRAYLDPQDEGLLMIYSNLGDIYRDKSGEKVDGTLTRDQKIAVECYNRAASIADRSGNPDYADVLRNNITKINNN